MSAYSPQKFKANILKYTYKIGFKSGTNWNYLNKDVQEVKIKILAV